MALDLNAILRNGLASRRSFLQRSGAAMIVGGGTALLAGRTASAAKVAKQFVPAKGAAELKTYFTQIQAHENAHVAFLVEALGVDARPEPVFKGLEQATFAKFVETSQALENTGVGAYLGAAPVIDSAAYLAAAGSILTIEARHAGWLNSILHDPLTGQATDVTTNVNFDVPLTIDQVVTNASAFVDNLNGGPDLTFDTTTSSPQNDIDILNFALALEYLERDFYNINVPKYYKAGK